MVSAMGETPGRPNGTHRKAFHPLRRPPPLRAGGTVALISPSSHTRSDSRHLLDEAAAVLEGWDLHPRLPEFPQRRHLYLAGTDHERAEELTARYCDPQIKALFATRGGYGAARMLPHLNAARISAADPTHVVGMSDVTALHAWLHATAGVTAIHGPCLSAPLHAASSFREANEARLRDLLFGEGPIGNSHPLSCRVLHRPPTALAVGTTALAEGMTVRGPLFGGNLTVLASLLATPWAPDLRGAILFLEDINEAPYRIDRVLTQFKLAGTFNHVAGIVFGHMKGCDEDSPGLLEAMLKDVFAEVPFPVATGLPAGHGTENTALLLGGEAVLHFPNDSDAGQLTFDA